MKASTQQHREVDIWDAETRVSWRNLTLERIIFGSHSRWYDGWCVYSHLAYAQKALSVNVYERRSQPSQIYWLSCLSTSSSSSMEWRALRRPAMKVCCFDIENLHGLQFVNTHFCARTHRSPRRKSFEFDFLCLFTAHQRTQESWVKSNRKKRAKAGGKKKKLTKLRAKCQKKKTDEPLRVVLRVCKSGDLKNSITSAKKISIFLFSTTPKREPTEPSNLRHHRECVVSTESVCARVGRSLIQFHCLSRASEINQKKKKCWFAFAFGLGSPLTLCAFVCLIQSLRASRRTVGRMKSRGKANDDEWSRLDGSSERARNPLWPLSRDMITQRGGQRNLEKLPSRRRAALLCVNLVVDKFHWIFGIFLLCLSRSLPSAPSRCLSLILIPAQHAIWALALAQTRKNWKTFKRVYSSSFGFISFHQSLCWLSRWAQLFYIYSYYVI